MILLNIYSMVGKDTQVLLKDTQVLLKDTINDIVETVKSSLQ